jgi:hypothetical protein
VQGTPFWQAGLDTAEHTYYRGCLL